MKLDMAIPAAGESFESMMSRWLTSFSCRLIALCGAYVDRDDEGKATKETFFCYTGIIGELEGRWYLVTAGHCIQELKAAFQEPKIEVTGIALVGGFGADNKLVAQPFHHFDDAPQNAVNNNEEGLDYGWMEIRPFYRHLLEQAGALPISLLEMNQPQTGNICNQIIVGFPENLVQKDMNSADWSQPIKGVIQPIMVTANVMNPLPDDIKPIANAWFVGHLFETSILDSAKGLSGAPILEVAEHTEGFVFRIIALQSWWKNQRRIIFGCPTAIFVPRLLDEIRKQHR